MFRFLKSIFSKNNEVKTNINKNNFLRTFFPTKSIYENKLKSILEDYPEEIRPTAWRMASEMYAGFEKGWSIDQIADNIINTKVFPGAPPESIRESVMQLGGQLIAPRISVSIDRKSSEIKSTPHSPKKKSSFRVTPVKIKAADTYDLEYSGYCHTSSDDIYTITWDENEGTFYLKKNNYVVVEGQAIRPYHAHVSNTGIFALADTETSIYYVISPNGEILIKTKLHANLGGVAVSDDGLYAMAQTYKCDKEDFSERIFIYDLKNRQLMTSFPRIVEGSHECKIDSVDKIIYLLYENPHRPYSILRYDFNGNLLDQDLWDEYCLQSASGYSLSIQASSILKEIKSNNLQDYRKVIFLLQTALKREVSDGTKAYILKHLGEVFYRCNNITKAVILFEEALRYNPRIGVKRLVAQLKKQSENKQESSRK